jgi:hypothetical protein
MPKLLGELSSPNQIRSKPCMIDLALFVLDMVVSQCFPFLSVRYADAWVWRVPCEIGCAFVLVAALHARPTDDVVEGEHLGSIFPPIR